MPDRFRKFTNDELEVLYESIESQAIIYDSIRLNKDEIVILYNEIEHERIQRKHRAHRELLPS